MRAVAGRAPLAALVTTLAAACGALDPAPPPLRSCKELHAAEPDLPSGTYVVDLDLDGPAAPWTTYCDMTTDGGGWTALLGKATAAGEPSIAGGVESIARVDSGAVGCEDQMPPRLQVANGWSTLSAYACRTTAFTVDLIWLDNTIDAHDTMFVATLQGETRHDIIVNGASVSPTSEDRGSLGAACAFWNAHARYADVPLDGCWSTVIDAPPQIVRDVYVDDLQISISVGAAGQPSAAWGTGWNLQQWFVR